MTRKTVVALLGFFLIPGVSCNGKVGEGVQSDRIIAEEVRKAVEQERIFFGHQSVGANILEGIGLLQGSFKGTTLKIIDLDKSAFQEGPALAHAALGTNKYPETKINAFSEKMSQGVGEWAEIALFKLCYVDVTRKTDIEALFDLYRKTIRDLKVRYARTVFVHVTVPLVCRSQGWKDVVKRILGRKLGSDDDNVKRNQYNQLLVSEYQGKEPIFDLALAESTHEDGSRESFMQGGKEYYALAREYASDGAHLNDRGKRRVAEMFLVALARASKNN